MAATPALERLAIPVFKEAEVSYEIHGNGEALSWMLRTPQFNLLCGVFDYPKMGLLSLDFFNLVAFEPKDDSNANRFGNQMNRKCLGKFTMDSDHQVDFCLELPYTEHTTAGDFTHALALAVATVSGKYPKWMQERWSKKPQRRKDPSKRSKSVQELIQEALESGS